MLIYSLEEVGHASFSAEHHIVNVKSSPKPSLSKSALCSSRWTLPAEKWRYRSEKRICFSKRSLGWDVSMQPKVCVTDKILPHWLLGEKVIVEVGQKLSLYDNHFACPLGYPFPEDSLSELICCFARRVAQLEYSCKENSQQPLRVLEASLQLRLGWPCSLRLLVRIKQMQACQIALLRLTPPSEWIRKCHKRKAHEHLIYRTQKMPCLLNPLPISGGESLFILELRMGGSQRWRLDVMLEATICVFSFPLVPRLLFDTAVLVGLCCAC